MFDDFVVSLRELAKTCKFCNNDCTQKNIHDQIIAGLADREAVEDLVKEKNLTLDIALSKCHAHEAAKRQRAELAEGSPETTIHAVRRKQQNLSSTLEARDAQDAELVSSLGDADNAPPTN